jgi:hypothetical protein
MGLGKSPRVFLRLQCLDTSHRPKLAKHDVIERNVPIYMNPPSMVVIPFTDRPIRHNGEQLNHATKQ